MIRHELRSEDIEIFSEAISHFFNICTGESASVRSAYLLAQGMSPPWNDFNGVIDLAGDYVGSICFSAPRGLLSHVLLKMGEASFTDDSHGDLVGEIANTLSGRARRHFGEGLVIAPPRLVFARAALSPPALSVPYAIPLCWHGYEANLIVDLSRHRDAGKKPSSSRCNTGLS